MSTTTSTTTRHRRRRPVWEILAIYGSFWSVVVALLNSGRGDRFFEADAAQARRRVTFRRDGVAYDREITTFTEDGRLAQVEYGLEASLRGSTVGAMRLELGSVLVVPEEAGGGGNQKGDGDDNNDDDSDSDDGPKRSSPSSSSCIVVCIEHSSFGKMHRIDDRVWMLTAGLSGDARMLANMARRSCQNHRLRYGEAPSVGQAARATAEFHHMLTRTGGCRPMGCTAILVGVDDPSTNGGGGGGGGIARIFRTDPGGGCEECTFCAAGRSRDAFANELAGLVEEWDDHEGEYEYEAAGDPSSLAAGESDETVGSGNGSGSGRKIARAAYRMADRFLRLLEKGGGSRSRSQSGGGPSSSAAAVATTTVDVWTIEPRRGCRGGMLATCYSDVRTDTVEKIVRMRTIPQPQPQPQTTT